MRKEGNRAYREAVGAALLGALLLVWINLAVDIIGSEDNPANWMYVGVLAVLISGAVMARLRPDGRAGALFATGAAQALATVMAITVEKHPDTLEILMLNEFFVAMWVGSAVLFWRAGACQV